MLPVPDAVHVAPPVGVQVHVALVNEAGSESTMLAPMASLGPLFDAVMVWVVVPPAVMVVAPSVLVTTRSTSALSVSLSLAVAGELEGSVAVAVFVSGFAVRFEAKATVAVNVRELPA